MKILVTGGAGYIGSCTVDELLKRGHEPTVLDSFCWGKGALDFAANRIKLVEGDVRSSRDLAYALQGVDAVIHLAGIVGDPACRKNPIANFTTNVESTRTLVNCMTDPEIGLVRDLIFASSCSVYGNVNGQYEEVTEETPPSPLSSYADGKLRSEEIIWAKAREVPHFHPTVLRLTTLFGWSYRPRLDLVANFFAHNALTKNEITIFGDGNQFRSLIHVRDVARALVAVLDSPRFARNRQIYHVGDERNNRTVKEIAELVKECVPTTRITLKSGAPTDRRDYRINCQRIRNTINWERSCTVEDGIRDVVENLRQSNLEFDPLRHGNAAYDYR